MHGVFVLFHSKTHLRVVGPAATDETALAARVVVLAAGLVEGIGVIVGTGSIAVGHTSFGSTVYAGGWGWGWELGDEGSAPGLVRAAVRAALRNHELAGPADPLGGYLMGSLGVACIADLPDRLRRNARSATWGSPAPAAFSAAEAGSVLAIEVIEDQAADLAEPVTRLRARGVASTCVVAAGGVVVSQPRLRAAVETSRWHATRPRRCRS